jgi:soluble lytic murein transglycosylase-like protein
MSDTLSFLLAAAAGLLLFRSQSEGDDAPAGTFTPSKVLNRDGENITSNFTPQELQWADLVAKYAGRWNVPPETVLATIADESGGDPNATGQSDEVGLGQLRPIAVQDVVQNTGLTQAGALAARTKGQAEANIQFTTAFLWLQRERWRQAGQMNWADVFRSYVCGFQGALDSPQCALSEAQTRMDLAGYN